MAYKKLNAPPHPKPNRTPPLRPYRRTQGVPIFWGYQRRTVVYWSRTNGAINKSPLYNDPGRILTGGLPAARRGGRGAVSLQDQSPSTVSSPLQRTSPEAGFRGGVYGDNMIAQQSSSYVSSNSSEWSHSWEMRKPKNNPKITINNVDGGKRPLCWKKNKLTMTAWLKS